MGVDPLLERYRDGILYETLPWEWTLYYRGTETVFFMRPCLGGGPFIREVQRRYSL